MKVRNEYFDFLRGIAIMMVVAIHTLPKVSGYNSLSEDLILVVRQILNWAVPLFLAISGYFLAGKSLSNRTEIHSFWRKQIPRVFIPMVIWGLGYFFLSVIIDPSPSNIVISTLMLLSGGFSIYYFVALIIQCYLILPILQKCKCGGVIICSVLSFSAVVLTNYYMFIEGISFPLLLYAGPVYLWVVFFMLGIIMSKYPHKSVLRIGTLILLSGLILQILESNFWLQHYNKGIGIKTSSFIFSIGVIMKLMSIQTQKAFKKSRLTRCIAWIGEVSFGVYLIHTYCILLLSRFIHTENWAIMWLITLFLSLVIIASMKRYFPSKMCRKYFGF